MEIFIECLNGRLTRRDGKAGFTGGANDETGVDRQHDEPPVRL
jgi:hypothetical protein